MTHIRRYDVTTGPAWQDGGQGEMEESPKGEYVRWADIAVLLSALALLEKLVDNGSWYPHAIELHGSGVDGDDLLAEAEAILDAADKKKEDRA